MEGGFLILVKNTMGYGLGHECENERIGGLCRLPPHPSPLPLQGGEGIGIRRGFLNSHPEWIKRLFH